MHVTSFNHASQDLNVDFHDKNKISTRGLPIPLHKYFYKSKTLDFFAEQLIQQLNTLSLTPLESSISSTVGAILSQLSAVTQTSSSASKQKSYQTALQQLRYLRRLTIDSKNESEKKVREKIQSISYWIYSSLDLTPYYEKLLDDHCSFQLQDLKVEDVRSDLELIYKDLFETLATPKAPSKKSSPTEIAQDFLLSGDIPSQLFTIKNRNGSETTFLRFSTVAKESLDENNVKAVSIVEEFTDFLNELDPKTPHLYINLMDRVNKDHREVDFSKAIEELEHHPVYGHKLRVISLDKQSMIYCWVENQNQNILCTDFKKMLLGHFFGPSFHWTHYLDKNLWEKQLTSIIDRVHSEYFFDELIIKSHEVQPFIELTYVHLILTLVDHFNPAFCNVTCRFSMDRGPSMTGLLYFHLLDSKKLQTNDTDVTKKIFTLLFAPAILVRGGVMQISRFKIMLQAMECFKESAYQKCVKADSGLLNREWKTWVLAKMEASIFKRQLDLNHCISSLRDRLVASYVRYQENVAMALLHWVDEWMMKASEENSQLIFLHQNEKDLQKSGQHLLKKFPERYPNLMLEDLIALNLPVYSTKSFIENAQIVSFFHSSSRMSKRAKILLHTGFTENNLEPLKDELSSHQFTYQIIAFINRRREVQNSSDVKKSFNHYLILKQFQTATKIEPFMHNLPPQEQIYPKLFSKNQKKWIENPHIYLYRKIQKQSLKDFTHQFDPLTSGNYSVNAQNRFLTLMNNLAKGEEAFYCPHDEQ